MITTFVDGEHSTWDHAQHLTKGQKLLFHNTYYVCCIIAR